MSYIETVNQRFGTDYQEQLSNRIIAVMKEWFDFEAAKIAANKILAEEHEANIAKMTDEEIEAVWTDLPCPTLNLSSDELMFEFCLNELKKVNKTIQHTINEAGVITIWVYSLDKEVKFQTKATFDISLTEMK